MTTVVSDQLSVVRTYALIRNQRTAKGSKDLVIKTGLTWEEGNRERAILDAEEISSKPLQSSWTRDVFSLHLEAAS